MEVLPQPQVQVSNVVYGNPNQYDLQLLKKPTYLDSILSEVDDLLPFQTEGEEIKKELHQVIQAISHIIEQPEYISRFTTYDSDIYDVIIESLSKHYPTERQKIKTIIQSIDEDISPLITKLKYKFQRPRPFQLGYAKKMFVYPFQTIYSQSPSYPSAHACQAKVIGEVLGNIYPKYYKQLIELALDIGQSRLYLGVNFKSCIDDGFLLADKIVGNIEFKKKYKV